MSPSEVIQSPHNDDTLDQSGNEVIVKIHQAAGIAEQNAQHVLGISHQTSMQLRVAEDKVAKLEAEIWAYKERAERAEEWLRRIEQEIEKTFAARQPQLQQSEDCVPKSAKSRR